jgi:hypothetical protein
MNYRDACNHMDTGFCLWIGAGLTVQVAGSPKDAPQWHQLTQDLERLGELGAQPDWRYPRRLEACSKELGDGPFRAELRRRYYTHLSMVLLRHAKKFLDRDDFIPPQARQVACLGQAANPIVNFNIEPLSSILLGRPAGPIRLLSYAEPHKRVLRHDEPNDRFRRLIYHPHGLITGACVMTESQYQSQSATLAFSLAVHAAFGSNLAIVGMSLEDDYLREQITRFRGDLECVWWFNSDFTKEPAEWAQANGVDMLQVQWPEFWDWWMEDRGFELDEKGMCAAWYRVLCEAWEEVQGGAATTSWLGLAQLGYDTGELTAVAELEEPGRPMDGVEEVSGVVDGVAGRIAGKGFSLPEIATLY